MQQLTTFICTVYCFAIGFLAYQFCYEVTTMGGHIPFVILMSGPVLLLLAMSTYQWSRS